MFSGKEKRGWGLAKKVETESTNQIPQNPSEQFAELYDEYFDKVNRYLRYRIGNLWDADDVTTIVFTKALEACRRDGITDHFGPWIFRIAQNAYVDYLRKRGRSITNYQELHAGLTDGKWHTEEQVLIKESSRTLNDMLNHLPTEYRDVVIMKYIAELKISEIASVLDKSEGSIKTTLYRGIRKLRALYTELERRESDE